METKEIKIWADELDNAGDAIQHASASGHGDAIALAGRFFVMDESEITRLAGAGISFAFLSDVKRKDGEYRICTVPVN